MGEKYSKEDHDKCKKVAEVFQELYDMLGDTCVLDAGEFGFVYLTYYREQKSCFDRNKVYRNAEELSLIFASYLIISLQFFSLSILYPIFSRRTISHVSP